MDLIRSTSVQYEILKVNMLEQQLFSPNRSLYVSPAALMIHTSEQCAGGPCWKRVVDEACFLYNRSGFTAFHRVHGEKPVLSPTGSEKRTHCCGKGLDSNRRDDVFLLLGVVKGNTCALVALLIS